MNTAMCSTGRMSFLRGSQNYVWSTTSVLGKGATGAVYQGVNNVTGEPVAVKTFNQISHLRPHDVQMREFEVLQKVDHENIVKLLAIEEERESRGKVIVMQLCTGGSLFNILDDPENTYGLAEDDFLAVLEDLTAGMKHLRDNHLVHRDLKPGNIMKYISDDGRTIYKLTDFGAARELPEGQQFQSLYGTEEYLHPDLYERAVLKKPANKTFGATIDLWSIGVTLYHVATGSLPFRPYIGSRKDKETMYHITTKKASGVISGIQVSENGPIVWRRTLPDQCQLSVGLRKIITPLLAGLLEADSKKIWTFDKFFAQVTDILARKRLHCFHVTRGVLCRIYIHPDENYTHLQNYVTEQTDVAAESQVLLYRSHAFRDYIREESNRAGGYPDTDAYTDPVYLFNKNDNNVSVVIDRHLPDFEDFTSGSTTSVESDAAQAKDACSLAYVCRRRIEQYSLACRLFDGSVTNYCAHISAELKQLNQRCRHLLEKTEIYRQLTPYLRTTEQYEPHELRRISATFTAETAKKVQQMADSYVVDGVLKRKWDVACGVGVAGSGRQPERARTEVERLRDSWQHLVRDRATRTLSHNDEQFHILERIKVTKTVARLRALLKEVGAQFEHIAETLSEWYKIAQTVYLKIAILTDDVRTFEGHLRKFELELAVHCDEYCSAYVVPNRNVEFRRRRRQQRQRQLVTAPDGTSPYLDDGNTLKVHSQQALRNQQHLENFVKLCTDEGKDLSDVADVNGKLLVEITKQLKTLQELKLV